MNDLIGTLSIERLGSHLIFTAPCSPEIFSKTALYIKYSNEDLHMQQEVRDPFIIPIENKIFYFRFNPFSLVKFLAFKPTHIQFHVGIDNIGYNFNKLNLEELKAILMDL